MTTTPTATASQLSAVAGEFDRIARYFRPLTSKNPGAFDLTDDAGRRVRGQRVATLGDQASGAVVEHDVADEDEPDWFGLDAKTQA